MTRIDDITLLDGGWTPDEAVVVIPASVAFALIEEGTIAQTVRDAFDALALSGNDVAILEGQA